MQLRVHRSKNAGTARLSRLPSDKISKSPTNWDSQLTKSLFQTCSGFIITIYGKEIHITISSAFEKNSLFFSDKNMH